MKKWFALSFDDGTQNDKRLVKLLDHYQVRATFHLNGGLIPLLDQTSENDRLSLKQLQTLYVNHEVAAHGFTHPDLTQLSNLEIRDELIKDIDFLDHSFNQSTLGFAYPFGVYDELVIKQLSQTKLIYARTIEDSHCFDVPSDLYRLNPTCHCKADDLLDLATQFVRSESNETQFFLVWGHSVEFVTDEDWARFEDFLKLISHQKDIFYGAILECIQQMKQDEKNN